MLLFVAAFTILRDWFAVPFADFCAANGVAILLVLAVPTAASSRRLFVAIGFGLALVAVVSRSDWQTIVFAAFGQGAFIATFFCALATLRTPSAISTAIIRCGEYLASQPPGKRYFALTSGGHLFALILNYGAIQLLGSFAESIAGREADEELREIRNRRMLLAIQRGFCASLLWSPLAFAMAITTSIIPGASWSGSAVYAIGSAVLFAAIGWALDTIIKPKYSGLRPARQTPRGSISDLKPFAILLLTIFVGVGLIELSTGLRVVTVVMVFIPLVAVIWLIIEAQRYERPMAIVRSRLRGLAFTEIPSYRSEIVLLVMAGIIGSLGA